MATLTVWKFETEQDAGRALTGLLDVKARDPAIVFDAATVAWAEGSPRPHTGPVVHAGSARGLAATFWAMLFGLIFFIPLLGAAVGSAPGGLAGWLTDAGISDYFVNRLRDEVVPGTSALFMIAPEPVIDMVEDILSEQDPAELITVRLNHDQEAALQQVFGE